VCVNPVYRSDVCVNPVCGVCVKPVHGGDVCVCTPVMVVTCV
jgi:hypothetical protein